MSEFCAGCGRPMASGDHAECERRQQATDPPRFCRDCGRKLVVQVLPIGWRARCVRCGDLPEECQMPTTFWTLVDKGKPRE